MLSMLRPGLSRPGCIGRFLETVIDALFGFDGMAEILPDLAMEALKSSGMVTRSSLPEALVTRPLARSMYCPRKQSFVLIDDTGTCFRKSYTIDIILLESPEHRLPQLHCVVEGPLNVTPTCCPHLK
jgi:hypothetical protein